MEDLRYERKIVLKNLYDNDLKALLKRLPGSFFEKYPARFINNVYYDTVNFDCFREGIWGVSDRQKFRVRWYGKLWQEEVSPILEIKKKKGKLGTKNYYPLPKLSIDKKNISILQKYVFNCDIPISLRDLFKLCKPVLLNRYLRDYYESRDGLCRITIDTNLSWRPIFLDNIVGSELNTNSVIMEIKYKNEHDFCISKYTKNLHITISKCSKYTLGVQSLYGLNV